ncbi:MAG: hypothetical protein IKZ22_01615, partial [Kiritimatiellae bacterium]|nr:hypothetical protein [Kiritimatiellia bacterium]
MKMSLFRKVAVLIVAAAAVAGCCCNCAKETVAKSPDGRNRIKLFTNPLSHEVTRDGVTMVKRSAIAMQLEGETLSGSGRVAKVSCGSYAGEEVSPVYKKSKISLKGNWVFADYGDWRIDTQFVHKMGSAYLLAVGVGKPIGAASTEVDIPRAGK